MRKISLLLLLTLIFNSCIQHVNDDITSDNLVVSKKLENNWPKEDEFYSIFYTGNFRPQLTDKRPAASDTSIKFCIPVAFTKLENDSIDGLFIVYGKVINRTSVNHHLGGGLLIRKFPSHQPDQLLSFIKTENGKILTENWIDSISNLKESFFQQIQLVRNGDALELHKDQKLFQRRAIVIFDDGKVAVVESKNAITLQEFANDLVKMKVIDAIYTDMGSFDEGWYRSYVSNDIIKIGKNRMETSRQSNWLIFRE